MLYITRPKRPKFLYQSDVSDFHIITVLAKDKYIRANFEIVQFRC